MPHHKRQSFSTSVSNYKSRSGYVYVAQSPEREDACKVGHTMRPPHVRMRELGRTTWLLPMRVHSARFFWNAVEVERDIHRALSPFRLPGTEEWFGVPAWQVSGLLRDVKQNAPSSEAEWEGGLSLAEQMEWALDLVNSRLRKFSQDGMRDIERLSALGHGPASWYLAEYLLANCPDDTDRALWVLDAAATQGHASASLRRAHLESLSSSDPKRRAWRHHVENFLNDHPDPTLWSQEDRATLRREAILWKRQPKYAWDNPLIRDLG